MSDNNPNENKNFIPTLDNLDTRNIQRVYLPLDGSEVINAIVAHVRKKLELEGRFEPHLSFEQVVWKFRLDVQWLGYANTSITREYTGAIVAEKDKPGEEEGDNKVNSDKKPVTSQITLTGEQLNRDLPPDDIRQKTNQPIPVVTTKGQGSGNVVKVPPGKLYKK